MRIKHLIITRFNIQISRTREASPSEEWMHERLRLFATYCLPSVVAQTKRDFTWLLLLDEQTAEPLMQELQEMIAEHPFIRIRKTAATNDLTALYKQIAAEEKGNAGWLLTTRLDNDDCISFDFVECLRAGAEKAIENLKEEASEKTAERKCVFSYPTGCQLFEKTEVMLQLLQPNNHFISLLEPADGDTRTVLDFDHREVEKMPTTLLRQEDIMWGEVVHGGNVLNGFTPHTPTKVVHVEKLPFPVDFNNYNNYRRNRRARVTMYLAYRWRSVKNLAKRLFGRK